MCVITPCLSNVYACLSNSNQIDLYFVAIACFELEKLYFIYDEIEIDTLELS